MRSGGILCHITSLPGGIVHGTLGADAFRFLDFLSHAGQSAWQMLPIHPPDRHGSPYASHSAFAADVNLLDDSQRPHPFTSGGLIAFRKQNAWVHDWALFQLAKQENGGTAWYEWPQPLRDREEQALDGLREDNRKEYWRLIGEQVDFEQQWSELRTAAEEKGIQLIGDMPFFVHHDSAEVWASRHLFQLDENGHPTSVAGVPPDAFSETGQVWNTPLYDWDSHRQDGFTWWKSRLAVSFRRFHRIRIDHFRAVEANWAIPAGASDGRIGAWQEGPGDALLIALLESADDGGLIAEDLGIIPPSVTDLRKRHHLPGMAVLQFAFDDGKEDNQHLIGNQSEDVVCYTGTHDNQTTQGWYESARGSEKPEHIRRVKAIADLAESQAVDESPVKTLIRAAYHSPANLSIIPLQDLMGLGDEARMNTPGTEQGNWGWRFTWDDLSEEHSKWLSELTSASRRTVSRPMQKGGIPQTTESAEQIGGEEPWGEPVAYFTAEVGLRSDLPTYSGGLGVLSGDHIKAAADAGLNFVAVTLLYRHGFGRQHLDDDGVQTETYPVFEPHGILEDTGIDIALPLDGTTLVSRIWRHGYVGESGGEVEIFFLDTAHPDNSPEHSTLGERLYGGDDSTRIRQEYLLGVGGVRALKALGRWPLRGLHLNEGHSAFASVEMLSQGWSKEKLASRTLFTTHTPVPAGHDRFDWDDVEQILGELLPAETRSKVGGSKCSMSHLAAYYAGKVNAVSVLNSEVAAEMYPGVNVHPVTNGVHHLTWTAPAMQEMLDANLPSWRTDPSLFAKCGELPAEPLSQARQRCRSVLHDLVRISAGVELDPDYLTIGFARRFATYKRADLVFRDLERLLELGEGRIQFVFAGKAHPRDEEGKKLIQNVYDASKALKGRIKVAFLENYSMTVGLAMTSGVDIWLNNPVRPMEASGTSGMKATLNGVPNCSILDGWWPEACEHGVNGWAIGGTEENRNDERDAKAVLDTLENEVIPAWQAGGETWLQLCRQAMVAGAGFTAARMIQDYRRFYTAFGN